MLYQWEIVQGFCIFTMTFEGKCNFKIWRPVCYLSFFVAFSFQLCIALWDKSVQQ